MEATLLLIVGLTGAVTLPIVVVFGIPALVLVLLTRVTNTGAAA